MLNWILRVFRGTKANSSKRALRHLIATFPDRFNGGTVRIVAVRFTDEGLKETEQRNTFEVRSTSVNATGDLVIVFADGDARRIPGRNIFMIDDETAPDVLQFIYSINEGLFQVTLQPMSP